MRCSVARSPSFFKWKMLRESAPYALLFLQLLIVPVPWSLVNDSTSSRDIRFTSFDTNVIHPFSSVCCFDGPPELGAVGPLFYALNEFSSLSSCVIRCRFCDLISHCRQPGLGGVLLVYVVSLLHGGQDLRWDLLRA